MLTSGVWPTMLTPFNEQGELDGESLARLTNWYLNKGVDGLFAVCQSSEMFALSLEERVRIAGEVVKTAAGRAPVIASGHIADGLEGQAEEIAAMASTGVEAVVLVTNRLASPHESDETWQHNVEELLCRLPDKIRLGFYECPYPYKRLLSPELLRWCANTGRFFFLKDTCCDAMMIERRMEAVKDSPFRLFNANSATLLASLQAGAAGYSGIMANFHPELYVWLLQNWRENPETAERLSDFLSLTSMIEKQLYPVNAKYGLQLEGILDGIYARSGQHEHFGATQKLEVEQLLRSGRAFAELLQMEPI
ncbi:dihydrodipicolinate synthase family protein [Paenibacillus sp. HB172176]|uniref:dihydrodipicolinate synthase family protein n=1 Tax=Paenibacillus sp. HB172176 TaxID=2493690 RepID=UPI00143B448C|nr:dihydrodipicolinate synthase family protein [Paenibacillus sp. HB172176]